MFPANDLRELKEAWRDVFRDTARFVRTWVCCASHDSPIVAQNCRDYQNTPDCIAESLVSYTHDAIRHHVSSQAKHIVIEDNWLELPADERDPLKTAEGGVVTHGDNLAEPLFDVESAAGLVADATTPGLSDVSVELTVTQPVTDKEPCSDPSQLAPPTDNDVKFHAVGPSSVYRVCQDVVEVKQHRRIPSRNRSDYGAAVTAEIKNRLGTPKDNEANRLAVRRMAHNIMSRHGVRPTHMRAVIERVIAAVFIPDEEDVIAAGMVKSRYASTMRSRVQGAGPSNKWTDIKEWLAEAFGVGGYAHVRRPAVA